METSAGAVRTSRSAWSKERLWVVLALVVAAGVWSAALVANGGHRSGSAGRAGGSSRASLSTFLRHYWWGHGRGFVIHRSGRGMEELRTYASSPPYYATLTFDVISVTGGSATADARIRVTAVRNSYKALSPGRIRVGTLGTLRLRHGVITDSITHATFCAPSVDRCGA